MIAIKDMDMPNNCKDCPFYEYRDDHEDCCWITMSGVQGVRYLNERHPDCPLVEIPKGHGRLIDADAYRKVMLNSREFDFFKTLDMQPTIIEADKER